MNRVPFPVLPTSIMLPQDCPAAIAWLPHVDVITFRHLLKLATSSFPRWWKTHGTLTLFLSKINECCRCSWIANASNQWWRLATDCWAVGASNTYTVNKYQFFMILSPVSYYSNSTGIHGIVGIDSKSFSASITSIVSITFIRLWYQHFINGMVVS